MAAWHDMIDRGKSMLGWKPKPVLHSVKRSRYDELDYRDLTDEVPVLNQLAYDLNEEHAYTGELVQDTFQLLYKGDPEILSEDEVDPRSWINRSVCNLIDSLPETEQTRRYTAHDKYGAAVATSSLEDKLDTELRNAEQVRDATEAAAQAREQARQAAAEAAAQAEALPELPDMGPLTEAQQQAMDALSDAVQQAEDAEAAAESADAQARDAVADLTRSVRTDVSDAIQSAHQQLRDEADMMAAWGVDPGVLKKMSFSERQELARKLSNNRLAEFRKLMGRYRMRAKAERARKTQHGRDEVYDTTLSGFLPDVLPVELVNLADEEMEWLFLQRFAEGQLLSRKWRGTERVGDGSVVAMIDCSYSMSETDGTNITREAFAKATALALLDQAHAAGRDFVAMNFASWNEQAVWTFPAKQPIDIDYLLSWVEHNFEGGTNYEVPLGRSMDIIEADFNAGKVRADMVLLTDDECKVSSEWMAQYQERKKRMDLRTFGVAIGLSAGTTLRAISDDVRSVYEFSQPDAVADLYRKV